MNSTTPHNPNPPASQTAEQTLRLIANLPAPAGLADRVHAALRSAHQRSDHKLFTDGTEENTLQQPPFGARAKNRGRVLAWPSALRPQSGWMRTAAAAAIVFVVAGGGWGVYTHVQQGLPAKVIIMPPRMPASGSFSGAGAIRTPQTLPGPAAPAPATPTPAQPKPAKKPPASSVPTVKGHRHPAALPAAK
jgi:hypothetical protein